MAPARRYCSCSVVRGDGTSTITRTPASASWVQNAGGQSRPDVVGALAGQYGADAGPTGALVKAAHGILCTSAPN